MGRPPNPGVNLNEGAFSRQDEEEESEWEWEYEYSQTETQDIYFTLQLPYTAPQQAKKKIVRRKKTTAKEKAVTAEDDGTQATPQAGSPGSDDETQAVDGSQTPAVNEVANPLDSDTAMQRAEEGTDTTVLEPKQLRLLDIGGSNPVLHINNQIYLCHWEQTVGTDLLIIPQIRSLAPASGASSDFANEDLSERRRNPQFEMLRTSSLRLVARPAKITRRQAPRAKSTVDAVSMTKQLEFQARLRDLKAKPSSTPTLKGTPTQQSVLPSRSPPTTSNPGHKPLRQASTHTASIDPRIQDIDANASVMNTMPEITENGQSPNAIQTRSTAIPSSEPRRTSARSEDRSSPLATTSIGPSTQASELAGVQLPQITAPALEKTLSATDSNVAVPTNMVNLCGKRTTLTDRVEDSHPARTSPAVTQVTSAAPANISIEETTVEKIADLNAAGTSPDNHRDGGIAMSFTASTQPPGAQDISSIAAADITRDETVSASINTVRKTAETSRLPAPVSPKPLAEIQSSEIGGNDITVPANSPGRKRKRAALHEAEGDTSTMEVPVSVVKDALHGKSPERPRTSSRMRKVTEKAVGLSTITPTDRARSRNATVEEGQLQASDTTVTAPKLPSPPKALPENATMEEEATTSEIPLLAYHQEAVDQDTVDQRIISEPRTSGRKRKATEKVVASSPLAKGERASSILQAILASKPPDGDSSNAATSSAPSIPPVASSSNGPARIRADTATGSSEDTPAPEQRALERKRKATTNLSPTDTTSLAAAEGAVADNGADFTPRVSGRKRKVTEKAAALTDQPNTKRSRR